MRSLIHRIRLKLRLISYYSANRPRSKWTRFQNVGLVVALALAVPCVFVAEVLVAQPTSVELVRGRMSGVRGAWVTAEVRAANHEGPWGVDPPIGEWSLTQARLERGWPVPSKVEEPPPSLEINDFNRVGVQTGVDLAANDMRRGAIASALAAAGERWTLPVPGAAATPVSRRQWGGFARNALVYWVLASLAVIVLAFVGRHAERLRRVKDAERVAVRESTGRCHVCDYDLRGLEFSARCPECGTLQR